MRCLQIALCVALALAASGCARQAHRIDADLKPALASMPGLDGGAERPVAAVMAPDGTRADPEAQARCWRAFFRAWHDTFADHDGPAVGFCGYRWDPYNAGGELDTGYGVLGKPAHEVLRRGFTDLRNTVPRRAGAWHPPGDG